MIYQYCILVAKTLPKCIRYKIEQTDDFYLPITENNYLEIHCKANENSKFDSSWVRSKNPKNLSINGTYEYFWNKKIYQNDKSIDILKEEIINELKSINYQELKFEQIHIDSNKIDSWWA